MNTEINEDEIIDLFDVYRIVNKKIKKIHFKQLLKQ